MTNIEIKSQGSNLCPFPDRLRASPSVEPALRRPRLPRFWSVDPYLRRNYGLDNLGPVESFTLTIIRLPGGKFSVRSGTSTIETLNSGRSGARAPNSGRIDPCLRRRKVLDPEDQQPHWDLGGEATDELWCNDVTRAGVTPSRDVTPSRARNVTPSQARGSRERVADLRRRMALGQQFVARPGRIGSR